MTLKVKERKTERSLIVFYVILFAWFFCALSKRKGKRRGANKNAHIKGEKKTLNEIIVRNL